MVDDVRAEKWGVHPAAEKLDGDKQKWINKWTKKWKCTVEMKITSTIIKTNWIRIITFCNKCKLCW